MTLNAMDMTAAEFQAGKRHLTDASRLAWLRQGDAAVLAALRQRHPDLAAKADAAARSAHQAAVRQVVAAHGRMQAAADAVGVAKHDPSPLLHQRAQAELAEAQATHDAFVIEAERLHGLLPNSVP